jgi:hypothetical protein
MLDFDIKELPNFTFSFNELLDYYNFVKTDFTHMMWTPDNFDTQDHKVNGLYSWAIQSNLKDANKPCPPYDVKHDTEVTGQFDTPTSMLVGFANKIVTCFPEVRQTVISAHPPGTVINQHVDNDEFLKIHIPIETNSDSFFVFGDKHYNLEITKAYLINTTRAHGTINKGSTDRIHLLFKFPINYADEILNKEWKL